MVVRCYVAVNDGVPCSWEVKSTMIHGVRFSTDLDCFHRSPVPEEENDGSIFLSISQVDWNVATGATGCVQPLTSHNCIFHTVMTACTVALSICVTLWQTVYTISYQEPMFLLSHMSYEFSVHMSWRLLPAFCGSDFINSVTTVAIFHTVMTVALSICVTLWQTVPFHSRNPCFY